MFTVYASATPVAANPDHAIPLRRRGDACTTFQIRASSSNIHMPNEGWVGTSSCCCDEMCYVMDKADDIEASVDLEVMAEGGHFNIWMKGGQSGKDGLTVGTITNTVVDLG